jgi:hypothetical protein
MTTDPSPGDDRAARLEALRRRQATRSTGPAGATARAVSPGTAGATSRAVSPGPQRRRRRRHAAAGGRILAGGLSAAVAVGLMGAMAHAATGTDEPSTGPATVGSTTPASTSGAPEGPSAPSTTPPPRVARTHAAPVTTSRGS